MWSESIVAPYVILAQMLSPKAIIIQQCIHQRPLFPLLHSSGNQGFLLLHNYDPPVMQVAVPIGKNARDRHGWACKAFITPAGMWKTSKNWTFQK